MISDKVDYLRSIQTFDTFRIRYKSVKLTKNTWQFFASTL